MGLKLDERFKLIKEYIENKTVLDIGFCSRGYRSDYRSDGWLHNNIKKYAKSVFGIDISKECIEFLRERGYNNVELANAETFNLNQKFDVVVAGELIEHLSNFQGFFNSVRKHLERDGLLILTTPNMFYFQETLFLVLRGYPPVHPEHTCYFEEITLRQLLGRFGFSAEKIMYVSEGYTREEKFELKKMLFRLIENLIPFKKIRFSYLVIVAKMVDKEEIDENNLSEEIRRELTNKLYKVLFKRDK